MHLLLFMYKQKTNVNIINCRVINTRLHNALVFTNEKPNSEKYINNVLYKWSYLFSFIHHMVCNAKSSPTFYPEKESYIPL